MFPYSLFNIIGFLLSDFSDQIFFIIPLDNAFEGLIFIIQQGTYVFKSGRNPADIGYRIPMEGDADAAVIFHFFFDISQVLFALLFGLLLFLTG